ncbi:MAG: DUF1659 domain-containing protein [Peptostreptococcaceae bacterium]
MAVQTKNPSGLKLRFDCGINEATGKTKVKSRTYSNVRPSATATELFEVGNSIGGLQKYDVLEIAKIDNSTLSE